MNSFKAHREILPETQRHIWPALSWTKTNGFVLYGGTAIALWWKASDDVLQIPQQFRDDLEKLSHDAEVRDPEDGRIGVDRGTALVGRLRSKQRDSASAEHVSATQLARE